MRRESIELASALALRAGRQALRMFRLPVLLGLLGLLATGCTSEATNPVGHGLVENPLSAFLDTLVIDDLVDYSALAIDQRTVPLNLQEVLYLGHQVSGEDSTSSVILVNFDFGAVYNDVYTPEVLTVGNINKVELRLWMLDFYGDLQPPDEKYLTKYYKLLQLKEPFNGEDYPGPIPESIEINTIPPVLTTSGEIVKIPLDDKQKFVDWLEAGETVGFMIKEWYFQPSTPGMVGFASRDMKHAASSLDTLDAFVSVGPSLLVDLVEPVPDEELLIIRPIADTSTFHKIDPAPVDPAEGFMMRTCLRNYPVLQFDLAQVPPNAFINRAILTVASDITTSYGKPEAVVVSEISTTAYESPLDILTLSRLAEEVYPISGMNNVDPTWGEHAVMRFNVTNAIQRFVNGVYEGERAFVLCAGEDFFPAYDLTNIDPHFYLVQFNFFGTAAADPLRPRLVITYSTSADLQEVAP